MHGTKNAYDRHGCRCELCRAGKRERGQAHKERLRAAVAAGDPTLKHGTSHLYSTGGCRCELCTAAAARAAKGWREAHPDATRAYSKKWREANAEKVVADRKQRQGARQPSGDSEPLSHVKTHGSGGYTLGCRCDACVTGRAEYLARWRERKQEVDIPHGTRNGFNNYGCRCEPCRDANVEYTGMQRAREQAQTMEGASKSGDLWTGAELELIVSRRDLTLRQLATMLGRTRYAVASARERAEADPKWVRVVGMTDGLIRTDGA